MRSITKKATAQGRMIACVRFYLSTFSAGRDSAVAKKPYNPVLGECFRCYYNVGMKDQQRPSLDLSADMKSEKQVKYVLVTFTCTFSLKMSFRLFRLIFR